MPHDPRKLLEDVRIAGERILVFTCDRSVDDYKTDEMLRSAVERQFEVIGEALNRLRRLDGKLASQTPECDQIIAFRNVLIHGYDLIDHTIVWSVVQTKLRPLIDQVRLLLA